MQIIAKQGRIQDFPLVWGGWGSLTTDSVAFGKKVCQNK